VTFTGWRDDIPELLSLFDLFVLASVTEACPIVVLEAMAMECPVVATDVGGVRELIPGDDYGWVVPPEDHRALSTAISDAIASEPNKDRTTNARERVERLFSLETCVENHVAVYRSLSYPADV
jgi:glycosyltransferase involved in cell wall biosynthesis